MQTINIEYAFVIALLAKGLGINETETAEQIRLSEEYKKVIDAMIHLQGITIEVIGNWIWVTGDIRPVKTELETAGLFFAKKKLA